MTEESVLARRELPILEFDPSPTAIIEPSRTTRPVPGIPERAVICFFQDVLSRLATEHRAEVVVHLRSEMGKHPVYRFKFDGNDFVVLQPGIGAPLAAGFLEEVIALGCRRFVACGGAGVLDREIAAGHILVPISAVRDEGTSYHYLPPSREVEAGPTAVAAIERTLTRHDIPYLETKTWTTDALYRETRARTRLRKEEGCLTVEMEAAALFAVARFRGVELGEMIYGGDNLDGDEWDSRHWTSRGEAREKLFWLAAEAVCDF